MKVIIGLLAASLAVLAGFFGGFKAGENHSSGSTTAAQVATGTGAGSSGGGASSGGGLFPGGGRFGGGNGAASCSTTSTRAVTTGSVTKVDGARITIHDAACNTDVIVTIGGDTRVRKTVDGQASDVSSGERVAVVGTRNADGSVNAQTVTINPAGGAFPGGGPGGSPSPSPSR